MYAARRSSLCGDVTAGCCCAAAAAAGWLGPSLCACVREWLEWSGLAPNPTNPIIVVVIAMVDGVGVAAFVYL